MSTIPNGSDRRKQILSTLRQSSAPVSGSALGRQTGVSRQVIVQDIALLRTEGYDILATARGYVIGGYHETVRLFKVRHTNEETEQELTLVVDLGGCVQDVMINHRVYGIMTAPLHIRNRRDVQHFMEELRTGKSAALMNITSGYHFHHISAESGEVLDEIEGALREQGFLAEMTPYEQETMPEREMDREAVRGAG